jgi:hypothetical protein
MRSLPKGDSKDMSTISSKQEKRQSFISPDLALVFIVLIATLVILGSSSSNAYSSLHNPPGIQDNAAGSVSSNNDVSFASDERYWHAKCSHGWSSDSMCDDIFSRAQLCTFNVTSAYCSDYDEYMQRYNNRYTIYYHY